MTLIGKNVELHPPKRLSSWRKVAIGTWRKSGDPSVYGMMDINAEPALKYIQEKRDKTGERITITHFVGKVAAEVMKRHPDINCLLRFGILYPRKNVDIFFQVASDLEGKDLSGTTIRNIDRLKIEEVARKMDGNVKSIRDGSDKTFKKMKNLTGMLPGFLSGLILDLGAFITMTLNLFIPAMGLPRDPFGGCMITSVGMLGLDAGFAPLVPYSRVPLLIAVGAVRDTPVVEDGKVVVQKTVRLCATLDHRLIDGIHASHMSKTLKELFANPYLLDS